MRKKTPVCQFASPLDVDIHSNPTNILLEGKYWKRQFDVIKAEYRKWRKNCKPKAIGSKICDSRSEIDILDYSPLSNDRNFINFADDFSDTLFSSLSGPLIFPDQREIAREAGNADFIQPSLGPLQPNFEEDLADLLNFRPLPTVPEEGTEDLLKNADYNFSQILGTDQMESSSMMSIHGQTTQSQTNIEDTTMVDLNMLSEYDVNTSVLKEVANFSSQSNVVFSNNAQQQQQQQQQSSNTSKQVTFPLNPEIIPANQQNLSNFPQTKGYGRIGKASSRPFKRQINYDSKCPPTSHQTNLYHQMLAQQQQQTLQPSYDSPPTAVIRPISGNYQIPLSSNIMAIPNNNNCNSVAMVKSYSVPQTMQISSTPQTIESISNFMMQPQHHSPPLNTSAQMDHFKAMSHQSSDVSYKPYPLGKKSQQQRVNSFSNDSQQPILQNISQQANILMVSHQQQQQQQQQMLPKEITRSNSLPINSTLPKVEMNKTSQLENNFAVPRLYAAKSSHKSRSRSNSVAPNQRGQLSSATSDPMLNKSALAQLLTNSNTNRLTNKQSSSTSAISSIGIQQNIGFNNSINALNQPSVSTYSKTVPMQNLQQHQPAAPPQQNIQHPLSPHKTTSLPVSPPHMMMNFPQTSFSAGLPTLSPESYDLDSSPLSPRASRDRRSGHIQAEQKRRCNIKNGFEALHSLIPQLQQNPNAKLSKAAMLQKGADYIKRLGGEKSVLQKKIEALKKERDDLNNSLSQLHSILPANGAPISRQRTEKVKSFYERYVHYRTRQNWKFWILGLILEPLLTSYTSTVSIASLEELRRTALLWIDQHCSLVDLRPAISNKLTYLSMNTDLLSENRSTLQEEVVKALNNKPGQHPNLSGT